MPIPHRTAATVVCVSAAALICYAAQRAYARARPGDTVRVDVGAVARRALTDGLDSIDQHLGALERDTTVAGRRRAFRAARRAYKHIEGLLAFYAPPVAEALNSNEAQPVDEDQADGAKMPRGFQRLEPWLFPEANTRAWSSAVREIAAMRLALARFRPVIPHIAPTPDECFEIARLEAARVATLGIAGFDASESGDAITESADALDGLRATPCAAGEAADAADRAIASAARYARDHHDFDAFDRFTFVRAYVNPAFDALARARVAPPAVPLRRTWPPGVASVYDARRFDPSAYASSDAGAPSAERVALGRELFFEPALSGNGRRSCASCHVPERAFTDGVPAAAALDPAGPKPTRNTPTVINAALQPAQFADARRATLEEQIGDVLSSPAEMGSSIAAAAARVAAMPAYQRRVTSERDLRAALAAYVRSLIAFDAPFDRALRGDTNAVSSAVRRGFNVFMGKAACGTCHFAPLFSGTVPPTFVVSDPEVIGVPRTLDARAPLDRDLGRGAIDRRSGMAHAFKTPSVRNAALTAPYMHNGALRTLDDVIDFYDRGGGAGRGLDVPNQTLAAHPLHLTAAERRELLAFLESLTDTAGTTARPHAPASPNTPH